MYPGFGGPSWEKSLRKALVSPALSMDRLRIDYGRRRSIMISPKNKGRADDAGDFDFKISNPIGSLATFE
ncbi:MAG: PH domain-containing protein [Nitrincola lacisaponensis]|uniref:PH domain-containing protein n=1 Tax=Nitrincola lacisaponensis TaxID=267850 RepID=UPI00391BA8E0